MKNKMKNIKSWTIAMLLISGSCISQVKYEIPKGFEIVIDSKLKQIRVDKDFDSDGEKDTFIILNQIGKKMER
jgi:hypothetical protein